MKSVRADFNRIDRQGRIRLSGTNLHSNPELERIGRQRRGEIWFQDGTELVPGSLERQGDEWFAVVDWDRHYEEADGIFWIPLTEAPIPAELPTISVRIPDVASDDFALGLRLPRAAVEPTGPLYHMRVWGGTASAGFGSPLENDPLDFQLPLVAGT